MNSSVPRRMQVARGLDTLRRRADLTQEDVAERARLSTGTVNRYLNWRTTPKLRAVTVKALAMACDGTPAEVDTLVRLADDAAEGWWAGNDAVPPWLNPLLGLETDAASEAEFATSAVPGLLQTPAYAAAQHLARDVRQAPGEIERTVDARIKRQAILDRTPPFHLWAVLDEAVLRRVVGSREVMAEQIDHLREMASRPNIEVQVLPFDAGAYTAVNGTFLMLGFERLGFEEAAVVYIEMPTGGTYLDQADDVAHYRLAWDYVRSQAANTAESMKMLAAANKEYRK